MSLELLSSLCSNEVDELALKAYKEPQACATNHASELAS